MRLQLRPGRRRLARVGAWGAAALLLSVAPVHAEGGGSLHLDTDTLFYADSDNVWVLSSELAISHDLDLSGGAAAASSVVDVVSAASVDVVSHATTRFQEVRVEGNMALSHAFGDTLPGVRYRISVEPDYVSHGVGASVEQRLGGADTTLSGGYFVSFDTIGRHGTAFDVWSRKLTSHTVDVGLTQNLDTRTVLRGVYTLTVQDGYMAKPYRYVPLFDPGGIARAEADGVTLGLSNFDEYRLSARPPENVPDLRVRHAIGLRGIRYLESLDAALRLDYRFYVDGWQLMAHTVELSLYKTLLEWLRLDVFGRAYAQSDAYFWKRTYVVESAGAIPTYRSADRQLSRYWTLTAGGRLEFVLKHFDIYAEFDAAHTRFDDFLYLDQRWVLIGQAGLEWTP